MLIKLRDELTRRVFRVDVENVFFGQRSAPSSPACWVKEPEECSVEHAGGELGTWIRGLRVSCAAWRFVGKAVDEQHDANQREECEEADKIVSVPGQPVTAEPSISVHLPAQLWNAAER